MTSLIERNLHLPIRRRLTALAVPSSSANELIPWSKPDWNAAPEGATHYYVGSSSPWRDLSDQDWRWWQDGRWCSPHDIEHDAYCKNLDLPSSGLLERNAQYLIARP